MDSNFAKKGVILVGKNIVTGKSSYKMPKNHISGKGESQEEKPALIVSKPGYYGFLLSMILPREGRRKLVSLSKCDNYPSKNHRKITIEPLRKSCLESQKPLLHQALNHTR